MPKMTAIWNKMAEFCIYRGGIQPQSKLGPNRWITWPALTSLTAGTNVTPVAGTRYTCSLYIPHSCLLTGIGYLIGTVGGTDKAIVELHDVDGTLLAKSAVAGVTVGTLATFQEIPFTEPLEVVGPGWYYVSVTMNGTTARLRAIATALGVSQVAYTKSATGTFGTVGDLTVPSSFTADVGPIAYVY